MGFSGEQENAGLTACCQDPHSKTTVGAAPEKTSPLPHLTQTPQLAAVMKKLHYWATLPLQRGCLYCHDLPKRWILQATTLMLLVSELKPPTGICCWTSLDYIPPSPTPSNKRANSRFYLEKVRTWEFYQGKGDQTSQVAPKIIFTISAKLLRVRVKQIFSDIQARKISIIPLKFSQKLLEEVLLPTRGCKERKIKTWVLGKGIHLRQDKGNPHVEGWAASPAWSRWIWASGGLAVRMSERAMRGIDTVVE